MFLFVLSIFCIELEKEKTEGHRKREKCQPIIIIINWSEIDKWCKNCPIQRHINSNSNEYKNQKQNQADLGLIR